MRETNSTTFIGIDQSLNSTGVYIKSAVGDYSVLITPKKLGLTGGARLAYIYDAVRSILEKETRCCYNVVVAMEGYAYDVKDGKVFELGECGGVVKLACAFKGITPIVVPPTNVKKFATGRATATKEQVMAAVNETQNDVADAKVLCQIAEATVNKNAASGLRHKLEVVSQCLGSKTKAPRASRRKKLQF